MFKKIKSFIHGYFIDIKRRISIWRNKRYDPYPDSPEGINLSSFVSHQNTLSEIKPRLSFNEKYIKDFYSWQNDAREKLIDLLSYNYPNIIINKKYEKQLSTIDNINRTKYYLSGFDGNDIPVTVLWSDKVEMHNILICLSGSASGVHLTWGEALMPSDPARLQTGADVGLQAAKHGFFVVCVEQRCYGEREERKLFPRSDARCVDAFNHALLLGRTLIGEKVIDISSVIDWLDKSEFSININRENIWIYGHSSGGTNAIYASAIDTRIKGIIASGCIGFISDTLLKRRDPEGHSIVPGFLNWFEFHDLVCLCAPRPFIGIGGKSDHIFPQNSMLEVISRTKPAYKALGAEEHINIITGPDGHRIYTEEMWSVLKKYFPEINTNPDIL